MPLSIRKHVAYAATPWEWRSRASVVGLVLAAIAVCVTWVAMEWADEGSNPFFVVAWYGGLGALMLVRPAVRSLRRWDDLHRT